MPDETPTPEPAPEPEPAPAPEPVEPDPRDGEEDVPSSHDTSGQFPADEVADTSSSD